MASSSRQRLSHGRRRLASTKWVARIFTLVWSISLGICSYFVILQTYHLSQSLQSSGLQTASLSTATTEKSIYAYYKNTGSFGKSSESDGNIPQKSSGETREEQIQRQKAAKENQAWFERRFHLGDQLSFVSSQNSGNSAVAATNSAGQSDKTFQLPKWMAIDASKQAKATINEEYIADECRGFNHTILRPKHGCQVNTDTQEVYCVFANLRIDNSRIHMDRGGEPLKDVMGREEYREFPRYDEGAFSTRPKPNYEVPTEYRLGLHYMEDVLNHVKYPTKKNKGEFDSSCVETRPGTTLLVTRYEYVNLYHTLTDWWNTFFVLTDAQKNRKEPVRILFLDAHAQGNLDPVWKDVFGSYEYVQHLPSGGVCFERAVFIPPGYLATVFPDNRITRIRCPLRRLADEFATHFLKTYGLEAVKPIPGKVVIIDRQPYVSHPRSKEGKFARVMNDLPELVKALKNNPKVTSVDLARFETMSFAEQVRTVRQAQILIGNHGAGLSHLMFMDRSAHVVEFSADYRGFFIYLSEWKDITHTPISLVDETRLTESEILRAYDLVDSIVS